MARRAGNWPKAALKRAAAAGAARRASSPGRPARSKSASADQTNQFAGFRRVFSSQIRQRSGPALHGLKVAYDQNRNSLVVRDGWGQTLLNVNLGTRRLNTADFSLTHARIHGHLLLVSLGIELLAIDLLQGAQPGLGRDPLAARTVRQHAGLQSLPAAGATSSS